MVTLFLYPEPNLKLRPKLLRELPRGARIVPYYWDMDDWPPLLVRQINRRPVEAVYAPSNASESAMA